jgi:hypothetical protein
MKPLSRSHPPGGSRQTSVLPMYARAWSCGARPDQAVHHPVLTAWHCAP